MDKRVIRCVDANRKNFSEYGVLVSTDGKTPNAELKEFSFWNALGVAEISGETSISIVEAYAETVLKETALEQHLATSEVLIPTGDIVVVVAKSKRSDQQTPDFDSMAAFKVKKGEAVIINKGIWHHAPLTHEKSVKTFVVFEKKTPDTDCRVLDLAKEFGFTVEVS